jgi:hypothetical protein
VTLLLMNSSDLKNNNNTLYEHKLADGSEQWFVVRDLGTALGGTGRFAPRRGDPVAFSSQPFITGVANGFIQFGYRGWHQELVRNRLTRADLAWAGRLLSGLSDRQWAEAFRAGGFTPEAAAPFIAVIKSRISQAVMVGGYRSTAGEGR